MSSSIGSNSLATSINDLPRDMLGEVFKHCGTVDRMYLRGVCPRWKSINEGNHVGQPLIPELITIRELNVLDNKIQGIEKGVLKLEKDTERAVNVQRNIENINLASMCISFGSAFFHWGLLGIDSIVQQLLASSR